MEGLLAIFLFEVKIFLSHMDQIGQSINTTDHKNISYDQMSTIIMNLLSKIKMMTPLKNLHIKINIY